MNMGFYGLRKFGRFVRRLFIWIPILWKQEDWDYAYIYPFLKQKLQELKNAYKKMIYTLIATNMQSDFDEAGFKNDKIVYY